MTDNEYRQQIAIAARRELRKPGRLSGLAKIILTIVSPWIAIAGLACIAVAIGSAPMWWPLVVAHANGLMIGAGLLLAILIVVVGVGMICINAINATNGSRDNER
jgi:hypothetical protein